MKIVKALTFKKKTSAFEKIHIPEVFWFSPMNFFELGKFMYCQGLQLTRLTIGQATG